PAERIGGLPTGRRRLVMAGMFGFAAYVIFIAAEPFAHSLVAAGEVMGVDKFLLVQWLAPIASEAPEFIVALLFVARRRAAAEMGSIEVRPLFAIGYAVCGFALLLDPKRRRAISQWPRFIRESVQARASHEVAVPATADEQSVVP